DAEEIMSFCRARLASYNAPHRVTFIDQLPKTSSGKILRRTIRAEAVEAAEAAREAAASAREATTAGAAAASAERASRRQVCCRSGYPRSGTTVGLAEDLGAQVLIVYDAR